MPKNGNGKMRLMHKHGADEASGPLQVCAVTFIHFCRSKLALCLAVLIAISLGIVDRDSMDILFDYFRQSAK